MKIIQVKTHKLYIIKSDRTIKFRLLNSYLIANWWPRVLNRMAPCASSWAHTMLQDALTCAVCCYVGLGCVCKLENNISQGVWWREWQLGIHRGKWCYSVEHRAAVGSHGQPCGRGEVQRSCQELQLCTECVDKLSTTAAVCGDTTWGWYCASHQAACKWCDFCLLLLLLLLLK